MLQDCSCLFKSYLFGSSCTLSKCYTLSYLILSVKNILLAYLEYEQHMHISVGHRAVDMIGSCRMDVIIHPLPFISCCEQFLCANTILVINGTCLFMSHHPSYSPVTNGDDKMNEPYKLGSHACYYLVSHLLLVMPVRLHHSLLHNSNKHVAKKTSYRLLSINPVSRSISPSWEEPEVFREDSYSCWRLLR